MSKIFSNQVYGKLGVENSVFRREDNAQVNADLSTTPLYQQLHDVTDTKEKAYFR